MTLNSIFQEVITWFDGETPGFNEVINTINGLIHSINITTAPSTAMLRITATGGTKIENMDTVKIEDMSTTKIENLGFFGENFIYDTTYNYLEMKLPIKSVKAIWLDATPWGSREFEDVKNNAIKDYYHTTGNRIYFSRDIKNYLEDDETHYLTLLVEMLYSTYETKNKDTEFVALEEFRALFISGCVYKLGAKSRYNKAVGNIGLKENKEEYKESLQHLHWRNIDKDNFGSYLDSGQKIDLGLTSETELLPNEYQLLMSQLASGIVYIGTQWKVVQEAATGDLVTYKLIGGVWVEMARVS